MQVIFTRNNSPISRLIRAVTREDVSHCGILIGGYVVHSNFLGLQIEPSEKFRKHSTIIHRVQVQARPDMLERLHYLYTRPYRPLYDFGAILFLGLSLSLRNYLRIPLPKSNLWASTGMYLCTELITDIIDGREDAMLTPYGLYLKLRRN